MTKRLTHFEVTKIVRAALKSAGYDYWNTHNDKLVGGRRRIKCYQNGHIHPNAKYASWLEAVRKEIKKNKLEDRVTCDFVSCERVGYGEYIAFVAYVQE